MRSRERTTEAKVVGIARGRAWRTLAGRGAGGGELAIRAPDTVVIHVGQELAQDNPGSWMEGAPDEPAKNSKPAVL
jgi:hypothetical protein